MTATAACVDDGEMRTLHHRTATARRIAEIAGQPADDKGIRRGRDDRGCARISERRTAIGTTGNRSGIPKFPASGRP